MLILSYDPSGAFLEGSGTTGYCLCDYNEKTQNIAIRGVGEIAAASYKTQQEYWDAHIALLDLCKPDQLVIEDFLLYAHKAKQQIGSKMETPQLIGVIKYECIKRNIPLTLQRAVDVKKRWTNEILVHKGILTYEKKHYMINGNLISRHIIDSIRHVLHFIMLERRKNNGK